MEDTRGIIVVGVDGRQEGDAALRFAVEEARRTGDSVEVVTSWLVEAIAPYPVAGSFITPEQLADEAGQRLDGAIARVLGDRPDLQIATRVIHGEPGPALVQAARGARLLVVGSRAMGAVRAALLGSVSRYCAHHAPCPVVVVPSPRSTRDVDLASQEVMVGGVR